jgi:RNA polymerase sigma factor (sigma-70 family)
MTDSQSLLAEFVLSGSDAAFRGLVTGYVDLVYSTALRLVGGDTHRAEDVAQTVFVDLARLARTLPKDVRLGGWLHRDTCFVAANVMRGERRRQFRERQAVEMNALQNESGADFSMVAPILDEAINELGEADRTAILLRFFEQQDFRLVGKALGSNEDAARMRVNRALGKLESLLKQRGVTTSAIALSVVLSANAVQAAPVGLAVTISTAATLTATPVASTTTLTAIKAIAMTTLQKAIIGATLAAIVGGGIYEAHLTSHLRDENQTLRQQQAPLAEQVQQLQHERDDATNRVASLKDELARTKSNNIELLKLRGEVARLRGNTPPQINDPIHDAMKTWLVRVAKLKQRIAETPEAKIPEFRFLSEED